MQGAPLFWSHSRWRETKQSHTATTPGRELQYSSKLMWNPWLFNGNYCHHKVIARFIFFLQCLHFEFNQLKQEESWISPKRMMWWNHFSRGQISPSLLGFISLISSAAFVPKIRVCKGPQSCKVVKCPWFLGGNSLALYPCKLIRSDLYLGSYTVNMGLGWRYWTFCSLLTMVCVCVCLVLCCMLIRPKNCKSSVCLHSHWDS